MRRRPSLLLATLALAALPLAAQTYPSKAMRRVVPFPAGGATDLLARSIAQRLGPAPGQTVVVNNKAGAGGSLGSAPVTTWFGIYGPRGLPAQFAALVQADSQRWAAIIRERKITLD